MRSVRSGIEAEDYRSGYRKAKIQQSHASDDTDDQGASAGASEQTGRLRLLIHRCLRKCDSSELPLLCISEILKENNLRRIRFHDLRHSCAGILISNRVPLVEVQQWLGHSTIRITADLYTHLAYEIKERSAAVMSDILLIRRNQPMKEIENYCPPYHRKSLHGQTGFCKATDS